MNRQDLRSIKNIYKEINSRSVSFSRLRKNTLPRPFKRMGGSRVESTGLLEVSKSLYVLFIWKTGDILTDTAFYGYLMRKEGDEILNLFEFHWHPSHKGYHCHVPCDAKNHDTNRMIPKDAPELDLINKNNPVPNLDPRDENDRLKLINFFCEKVNLRVINTDETAQFEIHLQ